MQDNKLLETGIKNNQAIFEVFNEAAQLGLSYSLNVWKEQSEYVAQNVGRSLAVAPQISGLTDADKIASFQKEVGAQEYQAFCESNESIRRLSEDAGEAFIKLGKKGQAIIAERVDETIEQTASSVPMLSNGNGKVWVDLMQNTNKMVYQLVDNGFDWAYQSSRNGADFILQKQAEAAEAATAVNGAAAQVVKGKKVSKRK